ncbi:MAG: ATP-binding protein [Methanoregula sp.]
MSSNIENLFSSLEIFTHCSNVDQFRDWLKQYPELDQNSIFQGYKFFVNLSAIMLHDSIAHDYSFDLKENSTYYYATSHGVSLEDIPNDSERVIFLKNVWKYFELIRTSRDWQELKDNIHKTREISSIFYKQILPNIAIKVKNKSKISNEEIIAFLTKRNVLFKLNDTSHGVPVGAIAKMISPFEGFSKPTFEGYVYSLEFLWSNLLGEKKFLISPANSLHDVKKLLSTEEYHELANEYFEFHEDDPVSKEWHFYHNALDTFFGKLYETEIHPLEKKLKNQNLEFSYVKKLDKKIIKSLLDPTTVKNPDYLIDDSREELVFKKLDYFFEWTSFNILDTQKSEDYSGVYAFIVFLSGLSTSKKLSKDVKIHALRIRHQVSGVDGFFYSYAILNDCSLFGGYDAGWIIFLTCATDYSGHGGSMHELAEFYIEKFENEEKISIKQVDVEETVFRRYIKHKIRSDADEYDADDHDEIHSEEEIIEYFSNVKDAYQKIFDGIPTRIHTNEKIVTNPDDSIEALISGGENQKVEFKSSIRWNYDENRKDTRLESLIARSIASFMNSDGGYLFIGINNDGEKIGLNNDYSTFGKNQRNKDGFQLQLTEIMNNYLGKALHQFITVKIFTDNSKDFCCVEVKPVHEPVFVIINNKKEFYIRENNRSQKLEIHEFHEYHNLRQKTQFDQN